VAIDPPFLSPVLKPENFAFTSGPINFNRMRKALILISLLFIAQLSFAQKKGNPIDETILTREIEAHLQFLAADEMRGRNAGSPEIEIAANYIRAYFKSQGLKTLPGAENYFQRVDQIRNIPPTSASANIAGQSFKLKESLLVLDGDSSEWKGDLLYVGYGSEAEIQKYDVKGKVILALAGSKDSDTGGKALNASAEKRTMLIKAGAGALIEIAATPQLPWPGLANYLSQRTWGLKKEAPPFPHLWIKPTDVSSLNLKEGQTVAGSFSFKGRKQTSVPGKNVVAWVEGTDPKLKEDYIIVTAHYDHIGVLNNKDGQDSIYNGARDNAVGTVALLQIAKYLSKNPVKHPVILVALTSEEKGLLGSQWYTDHPLAPLNKHILSINCDGVGYNDKTIITSISWGRTSTDPIVTKAAKAYGLGVGGDPDPKEGFFERSDQVSFARKGIVAIKLQPGLARMDDEIKKYYHRQADEVSSLDFEYLTKFYRTFVYAVELLGNETKKPSWNAGDKYEETSKKLYGL
jgi:hypothetical protein